MKAGVKFTGFSRSPNFCNGTITASAAECCVACGNDPACVGFMFDRSGVLGDGGVEDRWPQTAATCNATGNPPHTNCYPLGVIGGSETANNVVSGCPASRNGVCAGIGGNSTGVGYKVALYSPTGELLVVLTNASADLDFPAPSELPPGWAIQDSPRFYAPPWGATPVPDDVHISPALKNTSG